MEQCLISQADGARSVALKVINGRIDILRVTIDGIGSTAFKKVMSIIPGETETIIVKITSPANMHLRI